MLHFHSLIFTEKKCNKQTLGWEKIHQIIQFLDSFIHWIPMMSREKKSLVKLSHQTFVIGIHTHTQTERIHFILVVHYWWISQEFFFLPLSISLAFFFLKNLPIRWIPYSVHYDLRFAFPEIQILIHSFSQVKISER